MTAGNSDQYNHALAEVVTSRFLRKYAWLIDPSRGHSVNLFLLQDIVDFLEEIPALKNEGEALNIGIIIKNKMVRMGKPFVQRAPFHISKRQNFLKLKNVVDGSKLCYSVDDKGMVTIGQIPKRVIKNNSRNTLLNASNVFQTIAFWVGECRSEIYDCGKILQLNRRGIWIKPHDMPLDDFDNQGFPVQLSRHILEICLEMSEQNKGGTFVIIRGGSAKFCCSMINDCQFKQCAVKDLPTDQIIKLASVDGAMILNTDNQLLNIGQKLEAPLGTMYEKEPGRGTRHNSAAAYSSAVHSLVFVISEDGPISLYFKGKLHKRCFGELFGLEN